MLEFWSIWNMGNVVSAIWEHFNAGSREEICAVTFKDVPHPIYMRRGTSDYKNFLQIFYTDEYHEAAAALPETILDLGAYIGLSAIYFKLKVPQARIVCVEPSAENFEILRMNVEPYGIECVRGAVWPETRPVKIDHQLDGDWGNRIDKADDGDIDGISINDLMSRYDMASVDLIKMDIEETERVLFEKNIEWTDRVKVVACELHDRFVPGCSGAFFSVFHEPEFAISQEGETTLAVRK